MKKIVIILLLSIFAISCKLFYYTMPRSFKNRLLQEFTFTFDGKDTGIDALINIDGYYVVKRFWVNDSSYGFSHLMFFRDGMFAQDRAFHANSKRDVPDFFHDIYRDDRRSLGFHLYERTIWGRYKIFGDTIKVQYVERPILHSQGSPWFAMEVWYKAIDRNTILEIFSKPIGLCDRERRHFYNARKRYPITPLPSTFVPTDRIPCSESWIKRERWFWNNEDNWREYMRFLKK